MKMSIIYWSQTGNTQAMADAIADGARKAGAEVNLLAVDAAKAGDAKDCDLLALGCPSMGAEQLEESEFEPYFQSIEGELAGKKVALFGSYGWGDGQWMREWCDRAGAAGASVYRGEGLILNETPDDAGLEACRAFGSGFAGVS
ncbi:MAG: flavodoxin [Oscillospiraceae bacterium]|nr:flavodoxin [Oscillospiraceae bacterium]